VDLCNYLFFLKVALLESKSDKEGLKIFNFKERGNGKIV
jgi:hypothetical protein